MEHLYEILKSLNYQTIIGMFAVMWYFTKDIKENLIKLDSDVREKGNKVDKLYEIFAQSQKEQTIRTDKIYDMYMASMKNNKEK
jgi:hypothetical protein